MLITKNQHYAYFTACRPKVYSADTIPWSIWKKYESGEKSPRCMKRVRKIALKKMKGVKSHLVRQGFTHKCYEHAILSGKPRFVKYFTINSRSHKVGTFLKGKLGLSGKKHFLFSIKQKCVFIKNTFLFFEHSMTNVSQKSAKFTQHHSASIN